MEEETEGKATNPNLLNKAIGIIAGPAFGFVDGMHAANTINFQAVPAVLLGPKTTNMKDTSMNKLQAASMDTALITSGQCFMAANAVFFKPKQGLKSGWKNGATKLRGEFAFTEIKAKEFFDPRVKAARKRKELAVDNLTLPEDFKFIKLY